jgi:hypothetical protein
MPKFSNQATAGRHGHCSKPVAAACRPCCYGLLPGAAQELTSYTVYRWECAVRASVVMGFVGAGGLGQLMDQSMRMLNGGEAATILLTFLLLVLAADALSGLLRRQLGEARYALAGLAHGRCCGLAVLWLGVHYGGQLRLA